MQEVSLRNELSLSSNSPPRQIIRMQHFDVAEEKFLFQVSESGVDSSQGVLPLIGELGTLWTYLSRSTPNSPPCNNIFYVSQFPEYARSGCRTCHCKCISSTCHLPSNRRLTPTSTPTSTPTISHTQWHIRKSSVLHRN